MIGAPRVNSPELSVKHCRRHVSKSIWSPKDGMTRTAFYACRLFHFSGRNWTEHTIPVRRDGEGVDTVHAETDAPNGEVNMILNLLNRF